MTMPTAAMTLRRSRADRRETRELFYLSFLEKVITDPVIMGVTVSIGGMLLAQRITFSEDRDQDEALRALATATCVLAGTARAGAGGIASGVMATTAAASSSAETVANLTGANGFVNWLLGSDRKLFGLSIPGVTK